MRTSGGSNHGDTRDTRTGGGRRSKGAVWPAARPEHSGSGPSAQRRRGLKASVVKEDAVDRAPTLHEALIAQLDGLREHVLAALDGLPEGALDHVLAPSGWTLRGMVTHLLYDVEVFWMGAVLGADPSAIARVCDGWAAPSIPGPQLRRDYRTAAIDANKHLAQANLFTEPMWWPPPQLFGGPRLNSGLEVVLRALEETATHAGHLDMARERLDGHQHLVVT